MLGDIVDQNARFETGHVKVTTRAYLENKDQLPNDLALLEVDELIAKLKNQFPEVEWEKRIRFGGLLDAPDKNGLTKGQGPAAGMAVDLLSGEKQEIKRMNIPGAMVSGKIPIQNGQAIIGDDFAKKLEIGLGDEFAPVMQSLKQQNDLASLIDYSESVSGLFVSLFVVAMSIVLWNTGLLGGLRRYQEFGIRLALGESKGAIYKSLLLEAALIGVIGSVVGTIIGLSATYYLQTNGIDIGQYLDDATMMMPSIIRAKVSPDLFVLGFIPGLFAMVFGAMLSGLAIYRRETATLFKELEV